MAYSALARDGSSSGIRLPKPASAEMPAQAAPADAEAVGRPAAPAAPVVAVAGRPRRQERGGRDRHARAHDRDHPADGLDERPPTAAMTARPRAKNALARAGP